MRHEDALAAAISAIPLELSRIKSELREGLTEYHNGIALQGARYVKVGSGGGRSLACAGSGRLVGWSLRAITGAVTVTFADSRDNSGDIFATIELAAGASDTRWFGPGGVSFGDGLYVQVSTTTSGVIQGAVWLGAVD